MSGTSLDGVDAVLIHFADGLPLPSMVSHFNPYPENLRRRLRALQAPGPDELTAAARAANEIALRYADAVGAVLLKAAMKPEAVAAIGAHGQTLRHDPAAGYSLQILNAPLLAERTGITVVADFRNRDIAAGGQGAPLVPAFHDAIFRSPGQHRVILNIGGFANITRLAPNQSVIGFDCGPGNILLDAWAVQHLNQPMDAGGNWARTGKCHGPLLAEMRRHPFFQATPPKSCGYEQFSLGWLSTLPQVSELAPQDVQATLAALTVQGAADALKQWCPGTEEVYVCGGGAHNPVLLEGLQRALNGVRLGTTSAIGLDPDWVEAAAFAWLAHRRLAGLPGNLPSVTGADGPRVLGAIHAP